MGLRLLTCRNNGSAVRRWGVELIRTGAQGSGWFQRGRAILRLDRYRGNGRASWEVWAFGRQLKAANWWS